MSIPFTPANFGPTMLGYTGQQPFRFWCQKVLPLVYDDSLSYYELLNKVVDYLNNTISDVANVETNVDSLNTSFGSLQDFVNDKVGESIEAYNTLEGFVSDYFTNLDVQEEINVKLDAMATDGTLTQLLIDTGVIPDAVSEWLAENLTTTSPPVDKTLTIENAAADAEATGIAINAVETALMDSTISPEFTPTLVSGYIQNSNGKSGNSDKYCRTDLFTGKSAINVIEVNNPVYEFNIAYYDATGNLNGTGYIGYTGYKTGKQTVPYTGEIIGISFRRNDQATLTDSDNTAITNALKVYRLTDPTLTSENVAADAKTVGNEFSNLYWINSAATERKWRQAITRNSYIDTSTGATVTNSTFCRTNLYDKTSDIVGISVTKNIYKFYVAYYDDTGALDGTGYIGSSGWSQSVIMIPENVKKFAVVIAKTDNSTITVAVGADIQESMVIICPTDLSFSLPNKFADSATSKTAVNADKNAVKWTPKFTKGKYISGSTGALANNNDFAATEMHYGYGNIVEIIYKDDDYNYYVAMYGENGDLTGNGFIKISEWLTSDFVIPTYAKKFAIVASRVDHETLTNDDVTALNSALDCVTIKTENYESLDNVGLSETFNEVIALYDALASNYPAYATKNTLSYNTTNLYEYVFTTGNYNSGSGRRNQNPAIAKPVILICSGVHGYEKTSVMGLYSFCKRLCEKDYKLTDVINYATIKVIPIVCPSGYDNDSRLNSNGVNINRNFASSTWTQTSEGQNYSGASPADQDETKIVQNWMLANTSAMVYIDWHNSSYVSEISCLLGEMTDLALKYKKKYLLAMNKIIPYWQKFRGIDNTNIYAYTGGYNPGDTITSGTSTSYASDQGILAFTLETSWNVQGTGKHSNFSIGTSAETIACILNGYNDFMCEI